MAELTLTQAADVVSQHRTTVWVWIRDGLLPAQRRGRGDYLRIQVDDLRRFAVEHNYKFNEELARQYSA